MNQKKKKCNSCGQEWPNEFLQELEVFTDGSTEIEEVTVCTTCAEEIEENTEELKTELEETAVYNPRHLMMPAILSSSTNSY